MDESFLQSIDDTAGLSLTPEERTAARMGLRIKMELSLSSAEKTDIRRTLQKVIFADPTPSRMWSWLPIPGRLPAMAFSVLALLGLSGGGLVYAAEYALPGDTLYPVKVYVNEALIAQFQSTPLERAQWAVTVFQRRMNELNQLEARGTASGEIDATIGTSMEDSAANVETQVDALPAAAAERAAMRTAVRAAIGTDQDDVRRASRIARVLKALRDRAGDNNAAVLPSVAPVPSPIINIHLGTSSSSAKHSDESSSRTSRAIGSTSSTRNTATASTPSDQTSSVPPSEPRVQADAAASVSAEVDIPPVETPPVQIPPVVDPPAVLPQGL